MITWTDRAKAAIAPKGQIDTAKTDETAVSGLLAVSAVHSGTASPGLDGLSSVLAVHSPAVLQKHDSPSAVAQEPDRWCWPHSTAMNGAEIDAFAVRLNRFKGRGLTRAAADALADELVRRDRDHDERRHCLECRHLVGFSAENWRCGNWQAAGVAIRSGDAQLPAHFVVHLQRCDGFSGYIQSISRGTDDEHADD